MNATWIENVSTNLYYSFKANSSLISASQRPLRTSLFMSVGFFNWRLREHYKSNRFGDGDTTGEKKLKLVLVGKVKMWSTPDIWNQSKF